jgi:SET domain-containing protein
MDYVAEWKKLKVQGVLNDHLEIKESPGKGMGVFALRDIAEGDVIEYCHAIVLDWRRKYIGESQIRRYAYWSGCPCDDCKKHGDRAVIPLGYGCIYNSAEKQEEANAANHIHVNDSLQVFTAKRPIAAGEEILVWYGQGYLDYWCPRPEAAE